MDDRARAAAEPLAEATLADRFDLDKSRVLLNGAQAVARLLLTQKARDRRAGSEHRRLRFRLSRLAASAASTCNSSRSPTLFAANDIHFEPGLNEELAATAIWGAQQAEMRGEGKFDGVFGLWYGKGPGVDRSRRRVPPRQSRGNLAARRRARADGRRPHRRILDHRAPVGIRLRRRDDADPVARRRAGNPRLRRARLGLEPLRRRLGRHQMPQGHGRIRRPWSTRSLDRVNAGQRRAISSCRPAASTSARPTACSTQEARLQDHKRDAVVAWLAANKINRTDHVRRRRRPKIGIITAGKPYLDVRQALDELGIDEARCNALGLRIFKLGCVWPVVPEELACLRRRPRPHHRRRGEALADRERRCAKSSMASPIRRSSSARRDESGRMAVPGKGALDPNTIARRDRRAADEISPRRRARGGVGAAQGARARSPRSSEEAARTPYFCSGCPHNRSTVVPEGARAYAGIGCHFMALFMDRATDGFTQMGGEGANWVGEARFSKRGHVFQNLGDGTYNHSGALALRWAIDAKVNVTYKILFNDAVAMTGGQRHEGGLTVPQIAAPGRRRRRASASSSSPTSPTNIRRRRAGPRASRSARATN